MSLEYSEDDIIYNTYFDGWRVGKGMSNDLPPINPELSSAYYIGYTDGVWEEEENCWPLMVQTRKEIEQRLESGGGFA